jgi:hypothetical protein
MLMIVPRTRVIASKRHTHIIQPADRSQTDPNTSITETSETALWHAPAGNPTGVRRR